MGWQHSLQLIGILVVLGVVALLVFGQRHGSWPRRRNRFRRGALPLPRPECVGERNNVQAVP